MLSAQMDSYKCSETDISQTDMCDSETDSSDRQIGLKVRPTGLTMR